MPRAERLLPALFLLIPILLLAGTLIPGRSLVPFGAEEMDAVLWDAVQQDTPWKMEVQRSLAAGRIPLYSFGAFGGSPLLANNQSAPLYPGNVLYLLTDAVTALGPTLLLHLLLGFGGAYALVRTLGGAPAGGVVAGLSLTCSATMMAFLPHPQMTATLGLAPWLLWAVRRASLHPSARRCALIVGVAGLQLLAGHLQYAAFTWLSALIMTLVLSGARRIPILGLALGAALGAVQLLPTLDYATRAARLPLEVHGGLVDRYDHSVPPSHLAVLPWPEAYGNPETGRYFGQVNFRMYAMSIGAIPLALLLGGSTKRRETKLFLWLAAVALLLAVGTPLYGILLALPGWSSLKPARCIGLFTIAASIAAGLVVSRKPRCTRAAGRGLLVFGLACVPAALTGDIGIWKELAPSAGRVGLALLALLPLAAVKSLPRKQWALAGLAAAELFLFARPFARTWPVMDPYPMSQEERLLAEAGERFSSPIWSRILPNRAMALELMDARGTDSFIPWRYHRLARAIDPASDDMVRVRLAQGIARPVHALLASLVVAPPPAVARRVGLVRLGGDVYRDRRAPPLVFIPQRPHQVGDLGEALEQLLSPTFDPQRDGLWEGAVPTRPDASVDRVQRSPNRVVIETTVRAPSLLAVLHGYQPGWRARGRLGSYDVRPLNAVHLGIVLPAGESRIELRYEPPAFRLGLFLSGMALSLTLIMTLLRPTKFS